MSCTLRVIRSGRRILVALAAFVLTLGGSRAAAQDADPHAVQPERPTVATHAGTVAPGWLEIESGIEVDGLDHNGSAFVFPTVLKIGLAPRAQLSITVPAARPIAGSLGLGDLAVGVKWRVLARVPVLNNFAVLPALKFPTGASAAGRGTGTTDASLLLISSHTIGSASLDINVGYTRRSGDGSAAPRDATLWTAALGVPLRGALGLAAEVYGYPGTSGPAGASNIVAVLGGPTLLLRSWLAADAGVIIPLTGPQPHAMYAGGVWNVGRL